ncbi:hypothetical protein AURDEDRAFT_132187, partial [Auricularia subglabra TFB-10046 SS5]
MSDRESPLSPTPPPVTSAAALAPIDKTARAQLTAAQAVLARLVDNVKVADLMKKGHLLEPGGYISDSKTPEVTAVLVEHLPLHLVKCPICHLSGTHLAIVHVGGAHESFYQCDTCWVPFARWKMAGEIYESWMPDVHKDHMRARPEYPDRTVHLSVCDLSHLRIQVFTRVEGLWLSFNHLPHELIKAFNKRGIPYHIEVLQDIWTTLKLGTGGLNISERQYILVRVVRAVGPYDYPPPPPLASVIDLTAPAAPGDGAEKVDEAEPGPNPDDDDEPRRIFVVPQCFDYKK